MRAWLLVVLLVAAPLATPLPARAATFDLTVCNPDPLLNGLALRAVITTANSNGVSDTITLGACSYSLNTVDHLADGPNGLPSVVPDGGASLTIVGAGSATVVERAVGAPAFRLFHVTLGAALDLRDLTLHNGLAQGANGVDSSEPGFGGDGQGGAAYSLGSLTLRGVTLDGNVAQGGAGGENTDGAGGAGAGAGAGQGGALYSAGVLTISAGVLRGNRARGGQGGTGSDIVDGDGGDGGQGGPAQGGAIFCPAGASLSVSDTTFGSNWALGGVGGTSGRAPFNTGGVSGEGGSAQGGAIFYAAAAPVLSGLIFQDNRAVGGAGGEAAFGFNGGAGGAGGSGEGGAVFSEAAGLSPSGGLRLERNQAQGGAGGLAGSGDGGIGGPGGPGGDGYGGALMVLAGDADLAATTAPLISRNQAQGGAGAAGATGGGLGGQGGVGEGGAIFSKAGASLPGGGTVSQNQAQGGAGGLGSEANGGAGGRAQGGAIEVFDPAGSVSAGAGARLDDNQALGGAGADQGAGGAARGGAIYTAGSFSLSGAGLDTNLARGGQGGADAPGGGASGGAIYLTGFSSSASAVATLFRDNQAQGGPGGLGGSGGWAQGGAVCYASSTGSLGLSGAGVLDGNSAVGGAGAGDGAGGTALGGAVFLSSAFGISGQTFSNNRARGGAGAGSAAGGTAQGGALYSGVGLAASLSASSFSANIAQAGLGATAGVPSPAVAQGGALFNTALLTLDGGAFQGNQALGAAAVSGDEQQGGTAQGGALYNAPGATLSSSGATLFDSNSATGGRAGSRPAVSSGFSSGNGGGAGQGGALFAEGGLTLSGATLRANRAVGGQGGDIAGSGASLFAGAGGAGQGGALYLASGSASLTGVQAQANASQGGAGGSAPGGAGSPGPAEGGAVVSRADLTVSGGSFSANSLPTGGSGGAIASRGGTVRIDGASFASNSASGGEGGALLAFNTTLVSVSASLFSANSAVSAGAIAARADGGAVAVQIQTSTFRDNTATDADAGALALFGSSAEISDSTFSANRTLAAGGAGGAIVSQTTLRMVNTTIDGNSATGDAGGLLVRGDEATLDHVTITGNTADSDADGSGDGGGIQSPESAPLLTNSIVALNRDASPAAAGAAAPDLFASLSGGYNLIGNGAGAGGLGPTDLVGTSVAPLDPRLGTLGANGGPTETRLPLAGSPAINAGDPAFAPPPANDQRGTGFARVVGGRSDIGALELQLGPDAPMYRSSPLFPGPLVLAGPVGLPLDAAVGVTNIGAPGSLLNVTGASASPGFVVTTPLPAGLLPGASALPIGVRCTPDASGTLTGTLTVTTNEPGAPSYTYTLVCRLLGPAVSLAPNPLAFGSLLVGTTSPAQRATLRNTGNLTLTVSALVLSGEFVLGAAAAGDCPAAPPSFALAPGAACTIPVLFAPIALGLHSATLSVTDDVVGSPHTLVLSGTGVGQAVPDATLAPSPLVFPGLPVGDTSAARVLTLSSTGAAPLVVSTVSVSGSGFVLAPGGSGTCPLAPPSFTLDPGATCTLSVTFTPSSTGVQTGLLTLATNIGGAPLTASLVGSGLRIVPPADVYLPIVLKAGLADLAITSLQISPAKTSFRAGEPVLLAVTVTNQGSAPTTRGFWVDLYVDPARAPTVNTLWSDVCAIAPCVGVAWPVTTLLAPGQSITLTTVLPQFDPLRSFWTGWLPSGTTRIYALADSWNTVGTRGAVAETDEGNNQAVLDGLSVTGSNPPYRPWPNHVRPAASPVGVPERYEPRGGLEGR